MTSGKIKEDFFSICPIAPGIIAPGIGGSPTGQDAGCAVPVFPRWAGAAKAPLAAAPGRILFARFGPVHAGPIDRAHFLSEKAPEGTAAALRAFPGARR